MSGNLVTNPAYSYATRHDVRTPGWSDVTRRASVPKCTLADLIAWADAQGQAPENVTIGGGHISYRDTETEQERDQRLASIARADARHEEWERETFERLSKKFGSPVSGVAGNPEEAGEK